MGAKGATIFEEGKDAISNQLQQYLYKDKKKLEKEESLESYLMKHREIIIQILAQPIEDFLELQDNMVCSRSRIPFGTSPLKKMEMTAGLAGKNVISMYGSHYYASCN